MVNSESDRQNSKTWNRLQKGSKTTLRVQRQRELNPETSIKSLPKRMTYYVVFPLVASLRAKYTGEFLRFMEAIRGIPAAREGY